MLHFFCTLGAFIITLSVLITVHEFGHFWVARKCGVMVERFSVGFGRALWHWRDKHGTEYVIAVIPLGGYVKMLDDPADSNKLEHRRDTFNHKTAWQRTIIIVAGPLSNFLFAIFAYWLVFLIGIPSYRPIIGEIIPQSIADQATISPGTELKSVDGINTPDWESVRLQLINKIGAYETTIGITQFGSKSIEYKTLNLRNWKFEPNKQDAITALGMIPLGPSIEPILAKVQPRSAAMKAGLQPGDKIIKVNNQQVTSWQLFVTYIRDNPGRSIRVTIDRYGETRNIILQPDSKEISEGQVEGFAGVMPKIIPLSAEYKIIIQYAPLLALVMASEKTWQLTQLTVNMLSKLIAGDVKLSNLSGPISIAQGAGMSAEHGFIYYLTFLAMISINLGVINLFPLPVLDGGHLLFLAIEKIKGGPVSKRVQDFSYRISSILLMLIMSIALFNDFSRL